MGFFHFKEVKNEISELVSGLPKVRQLVSGRINVRVQSSLAFPFGVPPKSSQCNTCELRV